MEDELIELYDINTLSASDQGLLTVIHEAYKRGFSVSSNFAREHSAYVAMAASLGMLTTKVTANVYSREWRATIMGLSILNEMEINDDE